MLSQRSPAVLGPSASAEWLVIPSTSGGLYALADASNEEREAAALPPLYHFTAEPFLARAGGGPLFSLTLSLERQPEPGESSIIPLVRAATCALTVSVTPDGARLASAAPPRVEHRTLYSRRAVFRVSHGEQPLAEATIEGAAGQGALSMTVGRAEALALLWASRGDETGITVNCDLEFRASAQPLPSLDVTIDLARLQDYLSPCIGAERELYEALIRLALPVLIEQRIVVLDGGAPAPAPEDPALLEALLPDILRAAAPVLRPAGEGTPDGGRRFVLGNRPPEGATVTFHRSAAPAPSTRSLSLTRPLSEVLRGLGDEPGGIEAFVSAVCSDGRGGFEPLARHVSATRGQPSNSGHSAGSPGLAKLGGSAAALPAVLRTSSARPASAMALASSDLVLHRPPGRLQAWALDDLVVDRLDVAGERLQHLPVIQAGDDGASLWPDRVDANRYWYAPELVPIEPEVAAPAATSPFRFLFEVVGHDAEGRPGLEATIRVTLRQRMSAATEAAWQSRERPPAEPVPLNGLGVALQVPFRDDRGVTRAEPVQSATVEVRGTDLVATFRLTDRWARLCYGALSVEGYQQQPPRVLASYVFSAYVPIPERDSRLLLGGALAVTSILRRGALEATGAVDGTRAPGTARPATLAASYVALSPSLAVTHHAALAVHPHIVATAVVPPQQRFGIRTQGHTDSTAVVLPCNQFGALYVQSEAGDEHAIGCRDAYQLGQTELRLYERIDVQLSISRPGFSVYRSLQVPGRFLVLPDVYTIARYGAGDGRAYRPAVFLFSNVDAVHPERTRCVVMATLQPSIPEFRRRALLEHLREHYHPEATLQWPTELPGSPTYEWALAQGGGASRIEPTAAKTPDGFQVGLSTGIEGALQLQAMLRNGGIHAAVSFVPGDGTALTSMLSLDLADVGGPWDGGPLELSLAGAAATVTNRIDRAVDVDELVLYRDGKRSGLASIERRIEPGASLSVSLDSAAHEAVPVYSVAPGTAGLSEVRSFIEDIFTNAVFMNTIDLAARGLARINVEARIAGVEGLASGTLSAAEPAAELSFVLPLTSYLEHRTLEFRLTGISTDGAASAGAWRQWRLDTLGNVIEVTWEHLQGN